MDAELAETARMMRASFLDEREVEEEATEQLARKESDLVDVFLEAMQRGEPVRVRMGAVEFAGIVVHVADDLAVIDDDGGAQVDLRLSALDELWISPARPGAGRGRRSVAPACFDDCLEGLEATGREVELGGPGLPPTRRRVEVVARDHLVLAGGPGRHVVARRAVGFIVRRA